MSTVIGSKTADAYMQLASLGPMSIELTLKAGSTNIFHLDVGAANRMEALHMETQPGETVDQLCGRLKGMLRALWQGERMPEKLDKSDKLVQSGKQKVDQKVGKV